MDEIESYDPMDSLVWNAENKIKELEDRIQSYKNALQNILEQKHVWERHLYYLKQSGYYKQKAECMNLFQKEEEEDEIVPTQIS